MSELNGGNARLSARIGRRADALLTRHFTRPCITWRQALLILMPLLAETAFTNVFTLLNTAMVSSYGTSSLSAVSLVDSVNSFLNVFYIGMSTGASVVVANFRGKQDEQGLHDASAQAVTTVTAFTVVTMIIAIAFNGPLLRLLFGKADEEVLSKARVYMIGTALSLPIVGITTSSCGVLRGIGEGRTALGFSLLSTAKYVILNLLFMKVLRLGIQGLIYTISLSRALDLVILWALLKRSHSHLVLRPRAFIRIHPDIIKAIVAIGLPCAIEQLFFTAGRVATQAILVPMGNDAVAAYNISYSLMSFSQLFATPVHSAMYTIIGICIGARRSQDARELTRSYFILSTIIYILSIFAIALLFGTLMRFYNPPEDIIPLIFWCLMSTTVLQPIIHSFAFMLPNVLRAARDGTFCTVASLLVMWIFRVGCGWLLGSVVGLGVRGIWLAMIIDWIARAVIFPLRMRGGRWIERAIRLTDAGAS